MTLKRRSSTQEPRMIGEVATQEPRMIGKVATQPETLFRIIPLTYEPSPRYIYDVQEVEKLNKKLLNHADDIVLQEQITEAKRRADNILFASSAWTNEYIKWAQIVLKTFA